MGDTIPGDDERCTKTGGRWRCNLWKKQGSKYCEKHFLKYQLDRQRKKEQEHNRKTQNIKNDSEPITSNDDFAIHKLFGNKNDEDDDDLCTLVTKRGSKNSLSLHSAFFGIYPSEQKLKKKLKKAKRKAKETKKELENLKSSYESRIETLKKQLEDEALQKDIMKFNLEEALENVSSLLTEVVKAKAKGEASGSGDVIAELPYWINRGYLIGHASVLKKQRVPKDDPQWSDLQFPYPIKEPSVDFIHANLGIPYHDDASTEEES